MVAVLVPLLQANRLLLQNGTLTHFHLVSGSTGMPTITAGLPAQVSPRLATHYNSSKIRYKIR